MSRIKRESAIGYILRSHTLGLRVYSQIIPVRQAQNSKYKSEYDPLKAMPLSKGFSELTEPS